MAYGLDLNKRTSCQSRQHPISLHDSLIVRDYVFKERKWPAAFLFP